MELRTVVNTGRAPFSITYSDPVMFIGSCFAHEIGSWLKAGRMQVVINPAGTVYNPVSVINTLNSIISEKKVTPGDLYNNNGRWLSFSHSTEFSSADSLDLAAKINARSAESFEYIRKAKYLFITFGTASIFRLKSSGEVVSNCHKLPSELFTRELLKVTDIVSMWEEQLDKLHLLFPGMKVIFTISPVRHMKDGAHGNQVSKSVLFLAVEELLGHHTEPHYFPAYELLMDDLRDYRFYDSDMVHPSDTAVSYIWEAFAQCYLDQSTYSAWKEVSAVVKATGHRINTDSRKAVREFAESMLRKISRIGKSMPSVDLSADREYFEKLTSM